MSTLAMRATGMAAVAAVLVLLWLLIRAWQWLALGEADVPRYVLLKLAWRLILLVVMLALVGAGLGAIMWVCGFTA
jgi:hypothetical protein